ncbi:hypothetical protein [Neobacillus vireti]|uniref:hypothetical protein n=1 Tax=Neobacillus vireti TaxID=220686 RepID=UPI002FFE4713
MKIDLRYFPHAVLSPFSKDVKEGEFLTEIKASRTKTHFKFHVVFRLTNYYFLNLIEKGQVHYVIHMDCPKTRFREVYRSNTDTLDLEIDVRDLSGRVEISCLLLAKEQILDYGSDTFHPDYQNVSTIVNKGDILAVDKPKNFVAEVESDSLKVVPSIFTVWKNSDVEAPPYEVVFGETKIVIRLSEMNFQSYNQLRKNGVATNFITSSLVMPALILLLEKLEHSDNEGDTGFEDTKWFPIVKRRLRQLGIDIYDKSSFEDKKAQIALFMLGDPLSKGLEELQDLAMQIG